MNSLKSHYIARWELIIFADNFTIFVRVLSDPVAFSGQTYLIILFICSTLSGLLLSSFLCGALFLALSWPNLELRYLARSLPKFKIS